MENTMTFKHIDAQAYKQLAATHETTLLDIRDPESFAGGHIEHAIHIGQIEVDAFVQEQPKSKPLVICCYHGISSQSAADFFVGKGFTEVYSLDGGYEGWPG
jgi:thiosulfate sulfurtransferase